MKKLNADQLCGCACIMCGRKDRPLAPIMVETQFSTMLFHCTAQECACTKAEARAMVKATRQERGNQ